MSIPYEQLTFTNQFMFEKVLTRPENKNIVRRIIEMAIGEEVEDIQLVQSENSIQIYEYSVRREPLCPELRAAHSVQRATFIFR